MTTVAFCAFDKPGFLGGTSRWIQELLPALQAKKIKTRCYIFLHTGEKGPVTKYLESHGIECITTHAQYYTEDRVRWLLENLSRDSIDVFVPNEVPDAYHAARWVKEAGVPTVGVLHTGGVQSDIMQDLFVFGPPSDALSAIVCVSEHIEAAVRSRKPVGTRVRRIACGVEVPPTRVLPPRETMRIAYVGRLTEEAKRVSLVASAMCAAARAIPGIEATLYGDGPARGSVEQILATEGEGLPVKLGGMLDTGALRNALLDTHVIVLLSDYEGMPVAVMEAMACGCVPVCLNISSGVPELVNDGITGLLVQDRGDSFVAAVRRLRDDALLWERLSSNARRHIENGYSNQATTAEWINLLNEVSENSRPSKIRVPARIRIAPARPPYESPRSRKPHVSPLVTVYRKLRMNLGRMRQRLMTTGGARS